MSVMLKQGYKDPAEIPAVSTVTVEFNTSDTDTTRSRLSASEAADCGHLVG